MKAVWLSSTYYMDPAIERLTLAQEVLFLRAMAYCGGAESVGRVSRHALLSLGMRVAPANIRALVDAGLWIDEGGGNYRFRTWDHWQESGNDLLKRRKADRERQAKKRAAETEPSESCHVTAPAVSRDCHVTVTHTEERRVEKEIKSGTVSGISRGFTPENEKPPRGPAVSGQGWKLVRDVIPAHHPTSMRTALAQHAGALLLGGTPPADILAALELWLAKPHLGPGTLPSLVSEVIRNRDGAPHTAAVGGTTAKATGWLALAPSNQPRQRQELT